MNTIAVEQISTLKMSIYRYDPDSGKKPYMQEINVDIPKDKDIMVLDALHLAKEQDLQSLLEDPVERAFVVRMV